MLRATSNVFSFSPLDSVQVSYREHGAREWFEAPRLAAPGFDLSGATGKDSSTIDLKITMKGAPESEVIGELLLEPAFAVGDPALVVSVGNDNSRATDLPRQFKLYSNFPNPFNPTTTISFDLPNSEEVKVRIFNIRGQLVRTLADGPFRAGAHSLVWDSTNDESQQISSGVYIIRVKAGSHVSSGKLLLLK